MTTAYFGMRCPACGTTVDIGGGVEPNCPRCTTPMVPNKDFGGAMARVKCSNCGIMVGLTNAQFCPKCGGEFIPDK